MTTQHGAELPPAWKAWTAVLDASSLAGLRSGVRTFSAGQLATRRSSLRTELQRMDGSIEAARASLAGSDACHAAVDVELAALARELEATVAEHATRQCEHDSVLVVLEGERDRIAASEAADQELADVWGAVEAAEAEALRMAEALQVMNGELEGLKMGGRAARPPPFCGA